MERTEDAIVIDLAAYRRGRAAVPVIDPAAHAALLAEGMLMLSDMTAHQLALAVKDLRSSGSIRVG
jgi:hypothetical protein